MGAEDLTTGWASEPRRQSAREGQAGARYCSATQVTKKLL